VSAALIQWLNESGQKRHQPLFLCL